MKKISLVFLFLMMLCGIMAQSPEQFSYQAVVRNANNTLVAGAQVGVRVSVLQGTAAGAPVYVETHAVTTNTNGLMTLAIGDGTVQNGIFADIDWADGPYFLKTEIDPDGGSNYTITSTQQLLSVPYALYAKTAENGFSGDYNDLANTPTIPTVPTNISAFTNDAGYLTSYTETDPTVPAWAKEANKPTYNYSEIANTPTIPTVPTNVGAFTNDAGYITSYTETDPTVPAWAKEANKPTYNYSEIANTPTIPTVPTNVSAFTNDAGYLTEYTEHQALSISNDTIFLTGGGYVKLPAAAVGFSGDYNDLTNTPTIPTVPTNVGAFTNDVGYLTSYIETDPTVPAWAKEATKPAYDYSEITNTPAIPTVPTNVSAFTNDAGYITDYTETDPQFNAWNKDYNDLINKPVIPTIPTNISVFDNDAGYLTEYTEQQALSISNDTIFLTGGGYVKLPAAAVGFSGDYNDLTNTPAIPTVPTNVSAFANDAGYLTAAQCGDVDFCTLANYVSYLQQQVAALQYNINTMYNSIVEKPASDGQPCFGTPTVTDYDGNIYNTVQIGTQCWMKENLRTTHYADGTTIELGSDTSVSVAYRYYPNNDSNNVATYGYLYNRVAVMHGEPTSNSIPSGVQGICPEGWHVMSQGEWHQMTTYTTNITAYKCNIWYISKALAAADGWTNSNVNCSPGNGQEANNATGFTARPAGAAGALISPQFEYIPLGDCAVFWTSSVNSTNLNSDDYLYDLLDYHMSAHSSSACVGGDWGLSVRCLKD